MSKKANPRKASTFESYLRDEGVYEETTARAIKRVLARQLENAMKDRGMTKTAMAEEMRTSRAALDRLLDPEVESVTLGTLTKAARAVGRQIRFELV